MAIEKVKDYFRHYDLEHQILEFDVSSATVNEAAKALNIEGMRIAKTLAFRYFDQTLLIVTAGDAKIDNSKFKSQFNLKARMLDYDETESRVGHAVGGVCPFAINDNCIVVLDVSLQRFESVYPACGSSNSAMELKLEELVKYSNSTQWVDVCKEWK
ncbi:MAG: YbaK/EbsC family protein [Ignavibacteria bacterium]|nr:YbaK/EbsC family protein [Ignavibacteria bacterium]